MQTKSDQFLNENKWLLWKPCKLNDYQCNSILRFIIRRIPCIFILWYPYSFEIEHKILIVRF